MACAILFVWSVAATPSHASFQTEVEFNARAAEHLVNRAGFGAANDEIEAMVSAGLQATVDDLIGRALVEELPFFVERLSPRDGIMKADGMSDEMSAMEDMEMGNARQQAKLEKEMRIRETDQRDRFLAWWVTNMRAGVDPLGERMTLFWHGWFTSSYRDVKSSFEMIEQNQLFRKFGIGNFGELLSSMTRNAAMLEYLDNDSNKRKQPNENFARELMELFTLGEGQYTEEDVKNAARAFTGWSDRNGIFRFRRGQHDFGEKTLLGTTGDLDGDDVVEILLQQEACARFLARGLLLYFEGVEPSSHRLEKYAVALRKHEYNVAEMLRELFQDPAFYRDEVVGSRIAGPIDFLVGCARRLNLDPPGEALQMGAAALGQQLFEPPNVRGWEGGEAWITTGTVMMRSNLIGSYLGLLDMREELSDSARPMRALRRTRWDPVLNFTARLARESIERDSEIVDYMLDSLLAVSPAEDSRWTALKFMETAREAGDLNAGEREHALRRLAHLILSLPEANLN
ncbi:MAG: hypothetical protein ACI87A_001736 [Planctomycetota bacterium]